jgi:NAD(P)-dependent dehydrogenase (short-subunit alcohol dehydrogenase family)
MKVAGKIVVVTGGGRGIGRALCRRFAREGAAAVVVADLDAEPARDVAAEIGGLGLAVDASREDDVIELLDTVERTYGLPDLFCANAGVGADGDLDAPDALWEQSWRVNVMSHVYAARLVVPRMIRNGGGYLVHTASAAGLLSMPGAAPYVVAKHAAVAVAEYVSIRYGDKGIKVSCLCPQAVDTRLLREQTAPALVVLMLRVSPPLDPDGVAQSVVEGIDREVFLILPHADVAEHYRRRATDPDRWLAGMRRLARDIALD